MKAWFTLMDHLLLIPCAFEGNLNLLWKWQKLPLAMTTTSLYRELLLNAKP